MKYKKLLYIAALLSICILNLHKPSFASINTFDWQGYMSDIGYSKEEIPNEINDEDLRWLYDRWIKDLIEQLKYEAEENAYLATPEDKMEHVIDQTLLYAPDARSYFGLPDEIKDRDEPYYFFNFQNFVRNNTTVNDRPLTIGSFIAQYTRTIINRRTKWVRPFLYNMTEAEFAQRFKERNRLHDAMTVGDILDANPALGVGASRHAPTPAKQQPKSPLGKLKSGVKEKIRKMVE